MDCKLNIPYPEIKVEGPNEYYAKLLFDAYSGLVSELTAITLYSYQNFETFDYDTTFADMIKQIAMVEMHHLEILGKLINLLGSKPIYMNGNNVLWNASNVIYSTDIIDMLNTDIVSEEEAIIYYRELIDKIDDKYIVMNIERIILDEERHLECFRTFKANYLNKGL